MAIDAKTLAAALTPFAVKPQAWIVGDKHRLTEVPSLWEGIGRGAVFAFNGDARAEIGKSGENFGADLDAFSKYGIGAEFTGTDRINLANSIADSIDTGGTVAVVWTHDGTTNDGNFLDTRGGSSDGWELKIGIAIANQFNARIDTGPLVDVGVDISGAVAGELMRAVLRYDGANVFLDVANYGSDSAAITGKASRSTVPLIGNQANLAIPLGADRILHYMVISERSWSDAEADLFLHGPDAFAMIRPGLAKTLSLGFGEAGTPGYTAQGDLKAQATTISGTAEITQLADGALIAGLTTVAGVASIPVGDAPIAVDSTIGGNAGLTVTANKPPATAQNDTVLFIHASDGVTALTPPPGANSYFEESGGVPERVRTEISGLIAGASEPATYTASNSFTAYMFLVPIAIRGANNANPINTAILANNGDGPDPICPSVTTTVDDCLILRVLVSDGDNVPVTAPPGTTLIQNATLGGSAGLTIAVAWENQDIAGATGTAQFTQDPNQWQALTIAIRPPIPGAVSASGNLVAGLTTIAGMASIPVPLFAEGALVAQETTIAGVAEITQLADGALVSGLTQIAGQAVVPIYANGSLICGVTTIAALATYGDGWTPADPGGDETWNPVNSDPVDNWEPVNPGNKETWQ